MSNSCRNLGKNYVLAWNTGNNTHMTLIYLENVKRGYEQERVKWLANDFLREQLKAPETIELTLGEMMTDRCILVTNPLIKEIQEALYAYFTELGFTVRPLRSPHIDLRNQPKSIVTTTIQVSDWHV